MTISAMRDMSLRYEHKWIIIHFLQGECKYKFDFGEINKVSMRFLCACICMCMCKTETGEVTEKAALRSGEAKQVMEMHSDRNASHVYPRLGGWRRESTCLRTWSHMCTHQQMQGLASPHLQMSVNRVLSLIALRCCYTTTL